MGTGLWLCLFLVVAIITYLPYKGRNFRNIVWSKAIFLSSLFLVSSAVLVTIVWPTLKIEANSVTLAIFGITTLLWFIAPRFVRHFGKYPKSYLAKEDNETRFLAKVEPKTMMIKYFEVLFQQAGFIFLFFKVLAGFSLDERVLLFTVVVAIFHLGNILFMHAKWALFYFVLSIPVGFIFGYLLSRGLVFLTASIHLLLYIVFNVRYWFVNNEV